MITYLSEVPRIGKFIETQWKRGELELLFSEHRVTVWNKETAVEMNEMVIAAHCECT